MLGDGLATNKSVITLNINCCNLNSSVNMKDLMSGFQHNDSVQTLCLNENELKDEHALLILLMIKVKAERRDKIIWREGLRKPSRSSLCKTHGSSPTAAS